MSVSCCFFVVCFVGFLDREGAIAIILGKDFRIKVMKTQRPKQIITTLVWVFFYLDMKMKKKDKRMKKEDTVLSFK